MSTSKTRCCVFQSMFRCALVIGIGGSSFWPARGQAEDFPIDGGGTGRVYIDASGMVRARPIDEKQLEEARAKARIATLAVKDEKLCYISLPKLVDEVRTLQESRQEIPPTLRYLGGMTQLRYIFVYPDEKDLIIAGPADEFDPAGKDGPFGKRTGRPIMQLDDLVVAVRTAMKARRGGANAEAFGCDIEPAPDSMEKIAKVTKQLSGRPRPERIDAIAKAVGPQTVKLFNITDDTRFAFVCVAADYRLKRIALGVDPCAVPGVNNAIDSGRTPPSRVWFELAYEPLLVSADGNAFELRGPRLQVKAGEESFDVRGATRRAQTFAKVCTQKMPQICSAEPLFADLQNIADLSVLGAVIRSDKLDERVRWEMSRMLAVVAWPVASVPVAKTAETVLANPTGAVVAGGVNFETGPVVDKETRKTDEKKQLDPAKQAALQARTGSAVFVAK